MPSTGRTKEQMNQMWLSYKKTGRIEERNLLIDNYLYLVKYIAGKISRKLPKHISQEDIQSSGLLGLIKAIERYDVTQRYKFETYAVPVIRGAILDELRAQDWIPRSVRQKVKKFTEAKKELEQNLNREPSHEEIAAHLKLTRSKLTDLLQVISRAVTHAVQLDEVGEGEILLHEKIPDTNALTGDEIAHKKEMTHLLKEAIDRLPNQEKVVLALYYYEDLVLKDISKVLKVSESRVSQIHSSAIVHLKDVLKKYI